MAPVQLQTDTFASSRVLLHEIPAMPNLGVFHLGVAARELVGLALPTNRGRLLHYGTAALGAAGLFAVYETGEHGGELVFGYAGAWASVPGSPRT